MLRLLVTPRWLVRHVLLAGALGVCWWLGRWQLGRAFDRDSLLNWSYALEWFLFAGFSVLCWGWLLRDELRGDRSDDEPPAPAVEQPRAQPVSEEEDPELAAYNRMLADLNRKAQK